MKKNNTSNNTQKPVSLVVEELRENLAKSINESGLHISIIEMIVKELYLEVRKSAEIVSANEKAEYERMRNETESNNQEPGI